MTAAGVGEIAARIAAVRSRIELACGRAGRPHESVTLIAVSKTQPVSVINEAKATGLSTFGENYVQEALPKLAALGSGAPCAFHFIGHVQRNKARDVARAGFALIHSVDSVSLARAFASAGLDRPQPVLIQVNIAGEASKQGVAPAALPGLLHELRAIEAVDVQGLMTIAPQSADPEASRPWFRALRALASEAGLQYLSMGMTGDYEVAIEEGATHVRIGRAIFGERTA